MRWLVPMLAILAASCDASADVPTDGGWNATGRPFGSDIAELTVFADYPRYLWHARRLVIATTNEGDEPIEVTRIALRTGHFDWLPAESKSTVIAPGQRIDVQVDFGELVSCDDDPVGPTAVELSLASGDGPASRQIVDVDPAPLDAIRARECARRRVTDVVVVEFGADRSISGDRMRTSIEVDRRAGTNPIRVESLEGSVIIALRPLDDDTPLAELDENGNHASIPVELFIARCEPHAVSQSTLTWVISAFVTVADAQPHKLALDLPDTMRVELQEMIATCIAELAAAE